MKCTSFRLLSAMFVACVVSGTALAATPTPCRAGVKVPAECAGKVMPPDGPRVVVVLDGQAGAAPVQVPAAPSLDDYLEWHGRVAAGSAFSELMPWAALHLNAN